ncbi:site-specific integrase [Actinomadura bangladeshensis]|uniref:Site-specific integrase n=1 Tax=Actinomadura bangladeshensis TaxID=453573 RepID=A0A4R4P8S9_9ACTN|nr:site-specific integrase [Actinomadura bangladeshensis]
MERYLEPLLGDLLVAEVSVGHVERMLATIAHDHEQRGRPVTAATLHRIRATLRAALNAALRAGLIEENPASLVVLAPARRPRAVVWTAGRVEQWRRTGERPSVAVWTVAQTAQFLNGIRSHRLYAVYHLIALRGLRRGEAAGLRWCEVDLDGGTAVICRQVQRRNGRLTVCAPKTPHSNRVIALDRTTMAALRVHRSRQRAEQEAFGEGYRDSGYVFTNLNGEPVSPGWLTHQFQRLIAEQDIPPIRSHDPATFRSVPVRFGTAEQTTSGHVPPATMYRCPWDHRVAPTGGRTVPAAVGTSLLVIARKSSAGLAGYLADVAIDWPLTSR